MVTAFWEAAKQRGEKVSQKSRFPGGVSWLFHFQLFHLSGYLTSLCHCKSEKNKITYFRGAIMRVKELMMYYVRMVSGIRAQQMLAIIIASFIARTIEETESLIMILPFFAINHIPISQSCH